MSKYIVDNMFYINQGSYPYNNIIIKNNQTVKKFGSALCSYTMLICQKEKYNDINIAKNIIENLIEYYTDNYLNFNENIKNKIIYNKKYSVIKIFNIQEQIKNNIPVVLSLEQNNKIIHFVTVIGFDTLKNGYEKYKVMDPLKRSNTSLQDTIDDYSNSIIKDKFIIT